VASLIHKHICEYYVILTSNRPWLHKPQPVVTSKHVKILWDFTISTDRFISVNQPDIVAYDIFNHSVILLDVAIPVDVNIASKEQEKISKYQDLKLELQKLWNLTTIKICNSCNTGRCALPDMYARCPRARSARGRVCTYQSMHSCLCYN